MCCHFASMCINLNIESLLLDSVPPDDDFLDLIEQAFLEGQIDGKSEDLASAWLRVNHPSVQ